MSPEVVQELIGILAVISAGVGYATSKLISLLRARHPLPQTAPASPLARLGFLLLWSPRYTRIFAIVLAFLLATPCSVAAAWLGGTLTWGLVNGLLAVVLGQVRHALTDLSGEVAYPGPITDADAIDWLFDNGTFAVDERGQVTFTPKATAPEGLFIQPAKEDQDGQVGYRGTTPLA